ncbi:MAG TPA: peptidase M20 family protein [Actinobacteria bacterium]|jgi:acetylornithine deacetylase/succinyl-diaminopimelate desuccinylase-like protein|nr:peptidase M20 family protein [Actinomycetota bacterium]
MATTVDEVTDLLQHLIRNACVNDGTAVSGQEVRTVDVLQSYLEGGGLDVERYEPVPGRASLVTRIEGSDPNAPSLCLMGHSDVVPVNENGWTRDPFGGELVDGVVWGRGAVDMLNLTSSMAVAVKHLADSGFRPKGTLVYTAVADEEALGTHGAKWLVEHERDAVVTDYVVTEMGGMRMPLPSPSGPKLPVMVAEKGTYWCRLTVKGTPGHGSMPLRTDNAVVKAAVIVQRLAEFRPEAQMHDVWRRFVDAADLLPELRETLLDPEKVVAFAETFPDVGMARMVHAATHTTISPNIVHGGQKTNIIPDRVDLELDIRTLPGQTSGDVRAMLADALGPELFASVDITAQSDDESTASSLDNPLWDSITKVTEAMVPGTRTMPFLLVGATDARFFRRAGSIAYGYGLFSERIPFAQFMSMFHGDDERVDQESLDLSTNLWEALATDLLT